MVLSSQLIPFRPRSSPSVIGRAAAAPHWVSWKSQKRLAALRRAGGREAQNANAYGRYIYIHGTPEERNIGRPASYGCVRMRSHDVIQLYDIVGPGAKVTIVNEPLEAVLPNPSNAPQASGGQPASR